MKKPASLIKLAAIFTLFAFTLTGCLHFDEFKEAVGWQVSQIKEKGLVQASTELTEAALLVGLALPILLSDPRVIIMGSLAILDHDWKAKDILLLLDGAAFAVGYTTIVLAPSAVIALVGAVDTLNHPQAEKDYDDTPNFGESCHRDYECVHGVCSQGICTKWSITCGENSFFDSGRCHTCPDGATACRTQDKPRCFIDIDCPSGICLNGACVESSACTTDSDCPGNHDICLNNICVLANECAIDDHCAQNTDSGKLICNASLKCVKAHECTIDSDCGANEFCHQDLCLQCRFDSECATDEACLNGLCVAKSTLPAL